MKKAKFYLFENEIIFDENYVNILEVQNKDQFKKVCYLLNTHSKEKVDSNEFIYIENNKIIDISSRMHVINDFFNIEKNSKRILNLLYNDINNRYKDEFEEFDIIKKFDLIYNNIKEILIEYDYDFDYKVEIGVIDFLKAISLKFNEKNYDNPIKNLYFLFDIVSEFKTLDLLVLINLKSFLNDEELIEVYKAAKQRNLNLLCVEGYIDNKLKKYEKKLIIDNDYDEFIEKYSWY